MEDQFKSIPRIYKRQALDLMLFSFVNGMKAAMPSLQTRDCIRIFIHEHNLSGDDYSLEGARVKYYSMLKDFSEMQK